MTTGINVQEKEKFEFVQRLSRAAIDYVVEEEESQHTMLGLDLHVMKWSS
jgi:hypothetical protein